MIDLFIVRYSSMLSHRFHRQLVSVIYNVFKISDGVRTAVTGVFPGAAYPTTDVSDFDPETATSSVIGRLREDLIQYVLFRRIYGGPAKWTGLVSHKPRVNTLGMERVAAKWEQPQLIAPLEFAQTDGTISTCKVSGDRAEREGRQRVNQFFC